MIEQGNEYRAKANADRVDKVGGGGRARTAVAVRNNNDCDDGLTCTRSVLHCK